MQPVLVSCYWHLFYRTNGVDDPAGSTDTNMDDSIYASFLSGRHWAEFHGALWDLHPLQSKVHERTSVTHDAIILVLIGGPLWCQSRGPEFKRVQAAGISQPKRHASFISWRQTDGAHVCTQSHVDALQAYLGEPPTSNGPMLCSLVILRSLASV